MTASSLPCPSCHQVLTFGAPPAPGQSFKCPKCQTIFQAPSPAPAPPAAPPPARPAKPPAARVTGAKPAAARRSPAPAAPENAFSFVEDDRVESAAGGGRKRGGGFLMLALVGFVVLLLGAGGGGYAALYFTGALSAKPAVASSSNNPPKDAPKPPDDSKPPDDPKVAASRALLLGRWELQGSNPTLFTEFHDDGALVNGGGGQEMTGTWKLVDDATLDVALDVPGKPQMKRRLKIQAGKDLLAVTDEQNQVDAFQRPGAKPPPPPPSPPPPAGWQEYDSKEGLFTVLFPGTPEVSAPHKIQCRRGTASFEVLYRDLAPLELQDGQKACYNIVAGLIGQFLKSRKDIQLAGVSGMEIVAGGYPGYKGDNVSRCFLVKGRLYEARVSDLMGEVSPEDRARFLDSFQWTGEAPLVAMGPDNPPPPPPPPPPPADNTTPVPGSLRGQMQRVGDMSFAPLALEEKGLLGCMFWDGDKGDSFVVANGDGVVQRLSFPDFKLIKKKDLERKITWLSLSAEGVVVTVPEKGEVWLLDRDTFEMKKAMAADKVQRAVSAPSLSIAAAGCDDHFVILDLKTGKATPFTPEPGPFGARGCKAPLMTPDGKYLLAQGANESTICRYKVAGGKLQFEEESPGLATGAINVGLQVSPDSRFVCLPSGGGNAGAPKLYSTIIFPVTSLTKRECILEQGAYPEAVGFDPAGGYIYTQNHDFPVLVFTLTGVKKGQYSLNPGVRDLLDIHQYLVHPEGCKFLLLMQDQLNYVEVRPKKG